MTPAFDPYQGLIIVNTEDVGESGTALLRLALDTGATTTLINSGMLLSMLGLDFFRGNRLGIDFKQGLITLDQL